MTKRKDVPIMGKAKVTIGQATFNLPLGCTAAMGQAAATMHRAGGVSWAAVTAAQRVPTSGSPYHGVTNAMTGTLGKLHGGNGHDKANDLRASQARAHVLPALVVGNDRKPVIVCPVSGNKAHVIDHGRLLASIAGDKLPPFAKVNGGPDKSKASKSKASKASAKVPPVSKSDAPAPDAPAPAPDAPATS